MDLRIILKHLNLDAVGDPNLLVGFETADDAGVYKLTPDIALVQTLDFITPLCDDPFVFGQIAAANSLSDVYAMGGRPINVMNICCFPSEGCEPSVLAEILRGGNDKVKETGAVLLGGHTVKDQELKYGLSVTGVVHPDRVLRNSTCKPGDKLVITKKIGTGVIITGAKNDLLTPEEFQPALDSMAKLNKTASEAENSQAQRKEVALLSSPSAAGWRLGRGLEITGQPATNTWRTLDVSNRLPSVTSRLAILPFSIVPRRSPAPARRAALIVSAFRAASSARPPSRTERATPRTNSAGLCRPPMVKA